jgi:hypothetical protein
MFKFFKNGREINAPKRIKWYFSTKPETIFESAPEKLETNANFWRKKLEIEISSEILFVESTEWTMGVPQITPITEDECTTTTRSTTAQSSHSDVDSSTPLECDLSKDLEASINTPKPKSRRKAAGVSDLPADLSSDDSASA